MPFVLIAVLVVAAKVYAQGLLYFVVGKETVVIIICPQIKLSLAFSFRRTIQQREVASIYALRSSVLLILEVPGCILKLLLMTIISLLTVKPGQVSDFTLKIKLLLYLGNPLI